MTNSTILKQVREQRHLDLDDVASYVAISPKRLSQFEAGSKEPSFLQLEKLAAVYGVAPFAFVSDAIPNLEENLQDFRRTTPRPAHLSPGGLKRIWISEQIAQFTRQLQLELNLNLNSYFSQKQFSLDPVAAAEPFREFFDSWSEPRQRLLQFVGATDQIFLSTFRLFIESNGVAVLINDAPSEDYFGFYTKPDGSVPTAFINRQIMSKKAQLFTLAHELCHHFLNAEGVSNPFRTKNDVEKTCNQFAANFIAPASKFARLVEALPANVRRNPESLIAATSKISLLSGLASAVRLRETDFLSSKQVSNYFASRNIYSRKEKDDERDPGKPVFAPPHATALGKIGYLSAYVADKALTRKLVDSIDIHNGLSLSGDLQGGALSLAKRRFEVSLSS